MNESENRYSIPEFVIKSVVKSAIKNKDYDVLQSLCEKGHVDIVKMMIREAQK